MSSKGVRKSTRISYKSREQSVHAPTKRRSQQEESSSSSSSPSLSSMMLPPSGTFSKVRIQDPGMVVQMTSSKSSSQRQKSSPVPLLLKRCVPPSDGSLTGTSSSPAFLLGSPDLITCSTHGAPNLEIVSYELTNGKLIIHYRLLLVLVFS